MRGERKKWTNVVCACARVVRTTVEDLKINFAKLQNIQLSSLGDTDSVAANPDDVEGLDY